MRAESIGIYLRILREQPIENLLWLEQTIKDSIQYVSPVKAPMAESYLKKVQQIIKERLAKGNTECA